MRELNNIEQCKNNVDLVEFVKFVLGYDYDFQPQRKETDNQINYDFKKEKIRVSFLKDKKTFKYFNYIKNTNGDILNFIQEYYNIQFEEVFKKIKFVVSEMEDNNNFWSFRA